MVAKARQALSRRRFLYTAAAGAAAVTLAGCTGNGGGGGGGSLSAKGKPVTGGPKTTPNAGVIYPDGYLGPIASHKGVVTTERATLNVVVPEDVQVGDWASNAFTKWYEKRTNVHVSFKVVAGSNQDDRMTKVNAMISSGDLPDVFVGMNFSSSQLLLYGRDQKLFTPLGDIIDKYCVETKRIFHDYPEAKKFYTSADGKIYHLPDLNDCFHCKAGDDRVWIYQPWLKKLGLSMPETLDDFERVLEAFKTRDPNGDGKPDEIAFTTAKNDAGDVTLFDKFIMGSFLYNPGEPWLVVDNGKVDVVFDKPGWRDGLRYLHRLYAKGLIPKQAFTQTAEQLQRQGNAKTVVLGTVRQYYWAGFLTIDENAKHPRYQDYVCVPTLQGPNGFRTAGWDYYAPFGTGRFVVTTNSKVPEIAAMWCDGFYELEAVQRQYQGPLGKTWRWAKRGEVGINGKQAVYKDTVLWPPKPGLAWIQNGPMYRSDNYRLGEAVDPKAPTFEKALYENTKRAYYPYRQKEALELPRNLAIEESDAGTIADLQTTFSNYVQQMQVKFVTGQSDPNSAADWNTYLGTLKKMNLARYLSIYQKAYEKTPK